MPLIVWFSNKGSHFKDRNRWDQPYEYKEQGEKQADSPNERCPVPNGAGVHTPRGRQKVTMQAGHNNNIPFQPHPHIDNYRDTKQGQRAILNLAKPD